VLFLANKKGDRYECDECGLVILVENPCTCESCEIVCCGEPMNSISEKTENQNKQ